ncbi:hypothetical protein AB0C12_38535 [Actinoplanes sp. NPDC048967]|uniref:hypothetical protein n=1 Tax=Actinoplanes sp. NPDC048967 TaxID=3155269 RepID=UPI0033DDD40A
MNTSQVTELLDRAATSVTPSETDPAARMLALGRRSVRRRRAWKAAASAAVAVLTLPIVLAVVGRPGVDGQPGTPVRFGGVSVVVPDGWRTSTVQNFNACTAEPRTVYLAAQWDFMPSDSVPPGGGLVVCRSDGEPWMALVERGINPSLDPEQLVVRDEQLLQVEQAGTLGVTSTWTYRPYTGPIEATAALISGDEKRREQLLDRITWPAPPAAPASGGLTLPARITSATTDAPPGNGMVVATDARTLNRIRAALAELSDPVPAGAACVLRGSEAVGISIGEVTVVLGDENCPQAISTGGGRVRIPAGLGEELLGLIVASDRAATERATKD